MPSNSIKCKKELEPLDNSTSKNISRDEIHNIFTECSLLVKDDFWKQFYEDLALGKPPKGIFLVNGMIQTTNKRNGFSYSITDKAPQVIIKELHYLLLTHTSICSKKDMNKKRQIIDDIRKEFENYDTGKWTRIKRKRPW